MISLLLIAAAAQAHRVPPPAPPPPPEAGSAQFERDRDDLTVSLRRQCMSQAGIAITVEHWARARSVSRSRIASERALRQELGEAALTAPIDVARVERALEAGARFQEEQGAEYRRGAIAVLRALSPADRVIYARRLTVLAPAVPPRTC